MLAANFDVILRSDTVPGRVSISSLQRICRAFRFSMFFDDLVRKSVR